MKARQLAGTRPGPARTASAITWSTSPAPPMKRPDKQQPRNNLMLTPDPHEKPGLLTTWMSPVEQRGRKTHRRTGPDLCPPKSP